MHFHEFEAAPSVATHVASYWGMTVAPDTAETVHQLIPDGCISLVCGHTERSGVRVSILGPRATPLAVPVHPGDRFWGVRFWPDAGGAVLGLAPRSIAERVIAPITAPAWAAELGRRIATLEDAAAVATAANGALGNPVSAAPLDMVARSAVIGLIASRGEMPVSELAAGLDLSTRQLERRFGAAVGLTPKQFARIRRLRSALAHVLAPVPRTWSLVAAELGYADHAHLVRDALSLMGLTPSAAAARINAITHGSVRP